MTEKMTFREHIVQDRGVCPQGILHPAPPAARNLTPARRFCYHFACFRRRFPYREPFAQDLIFDTAGFAPATGRKAPQAKYPA